MASPVRLIAEEKPRGEQVRPLVLEAHDPGSLSRASDLVATGALTDRSGREFQSNDDLTAKDIPVEEGEGLSTSLSQVSGGNYITHEVTEDGKVGDSTDITSISPHATKISRSVAILEEHRDPDGSKHWPSNPDPEAGHLNDEIPQKTAEITRSSTPIEVQSSASSSSAPESDQESDKGSDQGSADASRLESDSIFDEQSESEQSNAATYDGSATDFGLDGSTFSRPLPTADFAPPPSIVNRLEEGQTPTSLNTDDAWNGPFHFQTGVEQMEMEIGKPPMTKESAAESLLSYEDSRKGTDTVGVHDAAQRLSSVRLPSSDQFGRLEARVPDDETAIDPAAAQLLADDEYIRQSLDENNAAQRSASHLPPSSDLPESRGLQDGLVPILGGIANAEAVLELVPEQSPAETPEEQSSPSRRKKEDLIGASDAEITLEKSQDNGQADSAVVQELSITRQPATLLETELSRENSNIPPTQRQEVRDHAESVGPLTSKAQQINVEIIDLESEEEGDASLQTVCQKDLQAPIQHDSGSAPTNEVSAHEDPLPLVSSTSEEHQTSMDEANRLSTPTDFTGLVLQPAATDEDFQPVDSYGKSQALEEVLEPEEEGSRKPLPVVRTENQGEELPSIDEALFQRSQGARLESGERELLSEEKPRVKQSQTARKKLKPITTDELPSTILDSLEDRFSKSQLLTPSSTQRTDFVSQASSLPPQAASENDTLPTPRLTQGTSTRIVPSQSLAPSEEPALTETAAPPRKTSALIEKLKEMRRLSNKTPKQRSSDASVLDPWFAPKRLSQAVPDSEAESEAESLPDRVAQAEIQKKASRQLLQTPEKPLAKSFIRSPPPPKHISSTQSSPKYLPPSQPPPPGFRTNLSYFVPLATLPSHFATTVDILAIALSSTPVTRATSGPRDYNQALYITDPSSSALQNSITTAQIFRPNNRCFPLVEKGDAFLLRNFKVQPFQRHLSLLSTESSAWAVFRKGADVQIRGPPVEFGAEERGFARGLWDWWASLGDDARNRFENAVPDYKKPHGLAKIATAKSGGNKSDTPIKKEEIEGLGVDLPGSQPKRRAAMGERFLDLNIREEADVVHESIEAPKRVLRARGAMGANGRSESARESRFGTVFTGGLGEPDETQGSAHELRDGKAYRDTSR